MGYDSRRFNKQAAGAVLSKVVFRPKNDRSVTHLLAAALTRATVQKIIVCAHGDLNVQHSYAIRRYHVSQPGGSSSRRGETPFQTGFRYWQDAARACVISENSVG